MRSDVRKIAYISRRALALLLTLAMVLAIVPPIDIFAATQDSSSKQIVFDATEGNEYYHKPIVINETTMKRGMKNENGEYTNVPFETRNGRYNILIKGEPFSVTVQGLTNVDITFNNVTIDRSADTGTSIDISSGGTNAGAAFLQASQDLKWTSGTNYYVPTCPFLIMDGADVVVSFVEQNVFRAAGNLWRIANSSATQLVRNSRDHYHGYAGIQVNYDSSLTIEGGNVEAWGAYQLKSLDKITDSASRIEAAKARYITRYDNSNTEDQAQDVHQDVSTTDYWAGNNAAGGAGIGGGTSYDCTVELQANGGGREYKWATPGNITINAGNIVAVGGFKSAGIGGGVNGAVSNGSITINGDSAISAANKTKVTAIGSFYAAGIGEGDSVPNAGSNKDFETLKYSIVINGGEVYAQGGYKASGIGTTDELTSSTQNNDLGLTSGMTIDLNGGDITALSGEAEITNNRPNPATAAIGAGDGTNMAPYSISIAEGTVVKAVSFSKYAISNIGTEATEAPQNVIDPNTYMYLAYYDRDGAVGSDDEDGREFHLYQIKRTDRGDFMLVVDHPDDVLDEVTPQSVFLGYDEKTNHLYVVDQNGKTITDSKTQCEIFYIEYHENSTPLYSAIGKGVDADGNEISVDLKDITGYEALVTEIGKLTQTSHVSYYFAEPEMKAFTVPAGYTAVAMTLYRPEDFGGRYIFHIPMDNSTQDVYAVIEKMSSGDSSGKVEAIFDSHFTMGNPLKPGRPAITPDKISATLTNLVVTSDTSLNLSLTDAEQKFAPGTKSYAIWLPANTAQFTVAPFWSTDVTTTVTIREGTRTIELDTPGEATTYNIGANDIKEIWIEKSDSGASKVVYKLTVRVKPNYEITFKNPDKVYDGLAATVSYDNMNSIAPTETIYKVTSTSQGTAGEWETGAVTYPTAQSVSKQTDTGSKNVTYANRTTTPISYTNAFTYDEKTKQLTITTTLSYSYYARQNDRTPETGSQEVVTVYKFIEDTFAWEYVSCTQPSFAFRPASGNRNTTNFEVLYQNNNTISIRGANNNNYVTAMFTFSTTSGNSTLSDNSAIVAVQAAQAARDKLKGKTVSSTADATLNYTVTQTVSSTLQLGTASVSVSKVSTQPVPITVAVTSSTKTNDTSGAVDVSSQLVGKTVTYEYDRVELNPNGTVKTVLETLGTSAPKDAGNYRVTASVNATEFQAAGERTFTISQRPITIIGIANWRYYLSEKDLANNAPPYIYITPGEDQGDGQFYSGEIRLDNVVEYADGKMDQVKLAIAENGMYFFDKVVGDLVSDKIVIKAAIDATDSVSANYTFAGYPDHGDYKHGEQVSGDIYQFRVPGQITYEVDGAMFLYGKLTAADQADFLWYKYYPVIDLTDPNVNLNSYLDFTKKDDGTYVDTRIDYHSPNNVTHAEHIYVRTVNEGKDEARYAVDITFGNMIFQYTKTIWNVNTLEYEKMDNASGETSVWVDPAVSGFAHGKALTNGDILIENRSNRPISFTATAEVNTHCVMVGYDQKTMEFDEGLMNQQHRVAARMIWGDTNVWKVEDITSENSRNTGSVGVATTPEIPIAAAENVGVGADSTALSNAPGYKIVSIRLFGIPTSSETVGSVTISLKPTN